MLSSRGARFYGFAYVWVLVLVAIMSIMVAGVLEFDATMQRREKEEQLLAIGREFREALRSYRDTPSPTGSHDYPEKLQELLADSRSGTVRRHLRKIYFDPLTGKKDWGVRLEGGRIAGVHSMASGLPIKEAEFAEDERFLVGAKSYREWVFGAN